MTHFLIVPFYKIKPLHTYAYLHKLIKSTTAKYVMIKNLNSRKNVKDNWKVNWTIT